MVEGVGVGMWLKVQEVCQVLWRLWLNCESVGGAPGVVEVAVEL